MAFNFDQYNALPDNQNWQSAFNPPKVVAPQKKKKDFWTDQISTGGSLAGALAGGAAGTAILPGVGTLIGALLGGGAGGAGGQVAENAISGDNLGQDVASEALWGGATALPFGAVGKLAKAGGTLVKGLGSEAARTAAKDLVTEAGVKTMTPKAVQALSISDALKNAPAQAAAERLASQSTLGQKLGDKLSGAANDLAIKQFRLNSSQINGLKPVLGEDPGAFIRKNGFNTVEDITTKGIDPLQSQYDNVISTMKSIPKSDVEKSFSDFIKPLKNSVSIDDRNLAKRLEAQSKDILKSINGSVSGNDLLALRRQFDNAVKRNAYGSAEMGMNKGTADALRRTLQTSADNLGLKTPEGRSLKQIGVDLNKLRTLDEIVSKQENLGRGSLPLSIPSLLGGAAGSGLGGIPGMAAGLVATNAINSPMGRKAAMGIIDGAASKVGQIGAGKVGQSIPQAVGRIGTVGAIKSSVGDQSLSDLNNMPVNAPMSNATKMPTSVQNIDSQYQNMQQMSSEPSIGGYSKSQIENAMAAAMIDGNSKAFTQLKGLYDLLPAQSSSPYGDLSQSSQNALASSDNAINTVDQLQQLYSNAGGARGRLGGLIGNFAADAGLDSNAKSYNSLSQASVTQIAKALAGAGAGTVSDMDAKVIIAALPTLQDTPEEAAIKFAALRQRLDAARQNTLMYGSGGGQSSSNLASALQG